jgi:hypothetical protein
METPHDSTDGKSYLDARMCGGNKRINLSMKALAQPVLLTFSGGLIIDVLYLQE